MNGEEKKTAELIRQVPELAAAVILLAVAETIPEDHPRAEDENTRRAAGQPERPQARLLQPGAD